MSSIVIELWPVMNDATSRPEQKLGPVAVQDDGAHAGRAGDLLGGRR